MDKNEYIEQRQKGLITTDMVWEMWENLKPEAAKEMDMDEFLHNFNLYCQHYGADKNRIYDYFDKKFDIVKVLDKNGNLLKIY